MALNKNVYKAQNKGNTWKGTLPFIFWSSFLHRERERSSLYLHFIKGWNGLQNHIRFGSQLGFVVKIFLFGSVHLDFSHRINSKPFVVIVLTYWYIHIYLVQTSWSSHNKRKSWSLWYPFLKSFLQITLRLLFIVAGTSWAQNKMIVTADVLSHYGQRGTWLLCANLIEVDWQQLILKRMHSKGEKGSCLHEGVDLSQRVKQSSMYCLKYIYTQSPVLHSVRLFILLPHYGCNIGNGQHWWLIFK